MPWNSWLEMVVVLLLLGFVVAGLIGLSGFLSLSRRFKTEIEDPEAAVPEPKPRNYQLKDYERLQ